jgi:hypothetical protein
MRNIILKFQPEGLYVRLVAKRRKDGMTGD